MKIQYVGKNIHVTDAIKSYVESRLEKIDKFFEDDYSVKLVISTQREHQTAEFTVYYPPITIRSEVTTDDLYASIDKAVDILVSQIIKQKKRIKNTSASIRFAKEESLEEKEEEKEIIKRKEIELVPMWEDEAIMQMELLNHDMFVFLDAEEGIVKVLYRRKDGQYGIISAII